MFPEPHLLYLQEKLNRFVKLMKILKWKKASGTIRLELLKSLGLSVLNYCSFLFLPQIYNKKLQDGFSKLYYKTIRISLNIP